MQIEWQLADLVEHERAARGLPEPAELAAARAGERSTLVTEQLALGQLARERAAVHGHQRPARDIAELVQGAREQLLARAALPGDQDGEAGASDTGGLLEHAAQGGRAAHDGTQGGEVGQGESGVFFVHAKVLGQRPKKLLRSGLPWRPVPSSDP